MDEIVKKAMAKWPNVPHCYGWLMLDARGAWRMRDEQAQAEHRAGDRIAHVALLAFIDRNYTCDDLGRWYFQNGPQRVYVNLEATPWIVRTDATGALQLHTGAMLGPVDAAWFTEEGQLLLQSAEKIALVDDRDLGQCLPSLRLDGAAVDDATLLHWVTEGGDATLTLLDRGKAVKVGRIAAADVPQRFGFVRVPQPA
jgi:hypothetical protein